MERKKKEHKEASERWWARKREVANENKKREKWEKWVYGRINDIIETEWMDKWERQRKTDRQRKWKNGNDYDCCRGYLGEEIGKRLKRWSISVAKRHVALFIKWKCIRGFIKTINHINFNYWFNSPYNIKE